jgi:hypothetical protein
MNNNIVAALDAELAQYTERPKGILVNITTFEELYNSGRLSLMRGIPDFGFELWALDRQIFVTIQPYLGAPFLLPVRA